MYAILIKYIRFVKRTRKFPVLTILKYIGAFDVFIIIEQIPLMHFNIWSLFFANIVALFRTTAHRVVIILASSFCRTKTRRFWTRAETKETEKERPSGRVICKMESGDAEIGMNNGRRAVWVVRMSAGTKHERARWDLRGKTKKRRREDIIDR